MWCYSESGQRYPLFGKHMQNMDKGSCKSSCFGPFFCTFIQLLGCVRSYFILNSAEFMTVNGTSGAS